MKHYFSHCAAKVAKHILLLCCLIPFAASSQLSQYFLFNRTFAENVGGPALTERLTCGAAAGAFGQQTLVRGGQCINFDAFCFNTGGGLAYPNPGVIGSSYTINVYCKLQGQGFLRVLDFSNGTVDNGIYFYQGFLIIYGIGAIGPGTLNLNTYYLFTFVRDGATNTLTVYVDGVLYGTIVDNLLVTRTPTNTSPIHFFTDNNCESPYGCVRYISASPLQATAPAVAALYASLPVLTNETAAPTVGITLTPATTTLTCTNPTATLTAGGGGTYAWSSSANNTATEVVSTANTYTVTVTDINGCSGTMASVVTADKTPPTATVTPTATLLNCTTTSIGLTAGGGGTYNWGGGVTTALKTVTTPATYTVTVTAANGCTATASSTITQNIAPPAAAISPASATLTCAAPTATLTASGGTGYNWGGGVTTAANTVSTANTYTVTVTGANGCTATASRTVSQNITPPVASISPAGGTITCAAPTLTLTASGGGTYNWGGGVTTAAKTVNAGGTYTVTVTAANGCTATASVIVSQATTPPTASITPATPALTCASPTVVLTASGGTSYNWGGGITTATNTVNTANTYTVTVTDVNGCTATASSVVSQSTAPPVAVVSPTSAILTCTNTSVLLTASGGATYNWGGGITSATNTVSAANTYTVTVTAANGCTATASASVTQNIVAPVASVTPANSTVTCVASNVTLTAGGGGTYDWGGGITTATNTVSSANTYTVTVTAANGCTATASAVVSLSVTPPTATVSPSTATITCASTTATLTASGGATYDWGGGNTTTTKTVNAGGTYTVTVTAANGCTATASAVVSQATTPPVAAVSPANAALTCAAPTALLTASGGTTYDWGGGITTATNTVNAANTYTVTVTDGNGCTATAAAVITQNTSLPVAAITPSTATLTCANTTATLTASGGATYNWGGGITTAANTVNAASTYTVTVTAANGCTATASAIVSQNITAPAASVTPANSTVTCVAPNVTLTASGGGTYDWGGGITTATNTVSSANTYTVTVTAANGCTATASAIVSLSVTPPTAAVSPSTATLTCATPNATLTASGGAAYDWGGGNTTNTNTVGTGGTYTVTVTAANGCTATASVVVSQTTTPPLATISPASITLTCAAPTAVLTASGGTSYDWGGGITTATNTVNTANTYTVTVTDGNGCTATASAVVSQNTTPPVAAITPATATLDCINTTSTLTASGGASYDWGGGTTTATNAVSTPNTYTVTVTAANGCTSTASAVVTQNITAPVASVTPATATITCVAPNVTLTASGGGTYDWGGGVTTATNAVSSANTYTVTVTAANGCTATASAVVSLNVTPPAVTVIPASATITCTNATATLTANAVATYDWGGGNTTATNTVSTAGTYTVTVTDINGCTATAASVVTLDIAAPAAAVSPANATLTCATNTSTLTASGGTTYDWGGGTTTAANTVNTANTYTVTVTGANGCTATASAVVTDDVTPPTAGINAPVTTLDCINTTSTLTASGGVTYDWGGGITTAANTVSAANTYTVTVTGSNGCTATASVVINQDIVTPTAAINPASATLTCANPSFVLTASGGATYNWGAGITTATNTVTNPNTYTVTVTGANGCTATASAIITQSVTTPPAAVSPASAALDCNTASAVLTASGGTSYNWGAGITTATNTVTAANTYTVTVTDINGCTATASASITDDFTPPAVTVTPANATLTCATLSATLRASGAISYDWGGGNTTATYTVNAANTYTVTATGSNGCTATAAAVVIQDITAPTAAIAPGTATLTCTNASLALLASGGVSYDWGAGITTASNSVTVPNTYTVTVTGANGCTATASSVISQNITPPTAAISPASGNLTCTTTAISLTASGGVTYDWGGGLTTATNSVTTPNTYTVTATGANGCTATAAAIITQDITAPNVSIAPAGTLNCAVLNTTLTASSTTANATFNWGGGNTTTTNTVTTGGNYTVTATDPANGCTASSTAAVAQNITSPNATVSVSGILSCVNLNATITAASTTPAATFDWGGGNNTATNTVAAPGNYTVTVTDPANSCTSTATQNVTQNIIAPPVAIATPAELNCVTFSVTLVANSTVAGITYDWGGGINTATNTVAAAGPYTVTATDPANGCTASANTTVNQNITIPTAVIAPPAVITCNSPTITLSASTSAASPAYTWGGSNTNSTFVVSTAGTYSVSITDLANGCSATNSATVTDVPLMNLSEIHTNVSCFGFADGAVDLTVAGGQPPFTYAWTNSTTLEDINAVTAGSYTVVVTDGISCTASITVQLTEPAPIQVSETHTMVTCNAANNGSINISVAAGTPAYTYLWSDNDINEDRNALAPGTYNVTVTDNNRCTATASIGITEPAALAIQPAVTQPTCATNGNDGDLTIAVTGGTLPYNYLWSNGPTTPANPKLGPGNFSVTVTDSNACIISDAYQLAYIYNFTVDASPFVSIKLGESTDLTYNLTGNTGNFTAEWSPADALSCTACQSPISTPVYTTLYDITITNEFGCKASDTVTVRVVPLYEMFIPNVFTPNGDGVNDLFQIFGNLNGVEYLEIQIFNKIGEKVFESNDHNFRWDGTYQGAALHPQIFVWQLKVTWLNEKRDEVRKGTLTLMK